MGIYFTKFHVKGEISLQGDEKPGMILIQIEDMEFQPFTLHSFH